MKKTLIFTSRDTNAAFQLLPIINKIISDNYLKVYVVASNSAARIFKKANIDIIPFSGCVESSCVLYDYAFKESDAESNRLFKEGADIIKKLKPDIIFSGHSSMGFGVDEILLYLAKKNKKHIKTYLFQDFWGAFNSIEKKYAETIFVIDEIAEKMSIKKTNSNIHIVGSPKYQDMMNNYQQIDRESARKKIGANKETVIVTLFAQSLSIEGILYSYRCFFGAIASLKDSNILLIIKVHPDKSEKKDFIELAKEYGINPLVFQRRDINLKLYTASDLLFTCTSLSGMDHAYLSSGAKEPIGCVIYLAIGNQFTGYLKAVCGFAEHPMVEKGIGYLARDKSDILNYIKNVKNSGIINNYYINAKMLKSENTIEKIVDIIYKENC